METMETIETKAPVLFEIDLRDTGHGRVPLKIEVQHDPPQRYLSRNYPSRRNTVTTITAEQETDKFNALREHYLISDALVRLILHLPVPSIPGQDGHATETPKACLDIEGRLYSVDSAQGNVKAVCIWSERSGRWF